jgi:hypothetical protein
MRYIHERNMNEMEKRWGSVNLKTEKAHYKKVKRKVRDENISIG